MFCKALAFCLACCCASTAAAQYRKISTLAGSGQAKPMQDKGMAATMPLSNPFGVQPEPDGSLIIASFDQHVLYRLDPAYRRMEVIAGTGHRGFSGMDGDFPSKVQLNEPHEVQVDAAGNIYVADTRNHRVGMIEAATGRWRTIAGTGEAGFSGDRRAATAAQLNQAYSIALDGELLFLADLGNHRVRQIDLSTGVIETICGTGEKAMPTNGGRALQQPLAGPRSLAVDPQNLWIVLREGNSVWRLDRDDRRLYHVAGTGEKGFEGDGGDANLARLNGPKGIAVEPGRAIYIADTENHAVRQVDLPSGRISTVVGTAGQSGFNGDGDELQNRWLKRPHGLCLLSTGELLIGDSENHRLRMLTR